MEVKEQNHNVDRRPKKREAFHHGQIRILEQIARGAPLKKILDHIVQLIESQIDGLASVLLLDKSRNKMRNGVGSHLPTELLNAIEGAPIGPEAGSCGTAAYFGKTVIVSDIATHPYWKNYHQFALPYGLKACWSSPIFSPDKKVLGTFAIYYREIRKPSQEEIRLVGSATHLTAIAIMKEQNEEALKQSETLYRQVLDTAYEGVITLDVDGNITFANWRVLQMLGYSSEELLGRSVFDLLTTSERRHVTEILSRQQIGMSNQNELLLQTQQGKKLWVIYTHSPILDETGYFTGTLGMLTDITERKQTEIALKRSEAELRTIFEGSAIGIALVDPTTRPIKCNPAFEKFLGYTSDELEETTILELVHAEDMMKILEKKRLLDINKADSYQMEIQLRQKSGLYVWARLTVSHIHLPNEQKSKTVIVAEDIRESKRLEEEISAAEKLRALIFDSVSDILYYLSVENNGRFRFLSVNESFLQAAGLRRDQVIGRFVDEVIPQPSLSLIVDKYHRAIFEHRTYRWDEITDYPSGKKFGEVTITPIFDKNDQCTGLVGTVHDITERKQAEEHIAAQAALLDHAHDAILLRSLDGTIRYWNKGASRLYGWTASETLGRKVAELLYKDPKIFEHAQQQVLEHGSWQGEIAQYTKDKRDIVIDASWTLLLDRENQPQAILAINTDITEKKKLQNQISLAQRMESLGILAGGIAHDFNNILTAITGNISLAQRYVDPNHRAQRNLEIATTACKRAEELVHRILSFSQRGETRHSLIRVQPIVEEAVQLLKSTLPDKIDLKTSWQPDLPFILANASEIHQIIMNLGTNAAHAMGNHGILRVSLDLATLHQPLVTLSNELAPGQYVHLTVADTGAGMDDETISRLLEPFFTTKSPGQGTGLGLPVVHGIVKDHGGGMVVHSKVGEGSQFEIYFPVAQMSQQTNIISRLKDPPLGQGERILYLDDETSVRTLSKHVLESCSYHVTDFADPIAALRAFQATPQDFDAILTDLAMPYLSGLEFIKSVRRVRNEIPIILASDHISEEDEKAAKELGVFEILHKPGSVSEMIYTLGHLFHHDESK